MRAGRRDTDHDIASPNRVASNHAVFLDDTNAKTGHVILTCGVHARMFCSFAANQRGAGLLAAARNAADNPGRNIDIESRCYKVIEKEQRFGTDDSDVVNAHGDQIDSDRIMGVVFDREFQFGANTVGTGYQHRRSIAGRHPEQSAEPTETTDDLGAAGGLDSWFDSIDKCLTGIDVDSGCLVGQFLIRMSAHSEL